MDEIGEIAVGAAAKLGEVRSDVRDAGDIVESIHSIAGTSGNIA